MAAPQPPEGAVSKGQVHSVFKARLNDLVSQGTVFAEAFKRAQGVQRVWNVPSNLTASNLFDIPSLHKESFEREPINTNYLQCFQDPEAMGTIGALNPRWVEWLMGYPDGWTDLDNSATP